MTSWTRASASALLLALASLVTGCNGDSSGRASVTTTTAPPRDRSVALPALHATRGAAAALVDARGRRVLLRGVNLNSLGDYYQDDPALPPVVAVTEKDWADMEAHGFDVVRL